MKTLEVHHLLSYLKKKKKYKKDTYEDARYIGLKKKEDSRCTTSCPTCVCVFVCVWCGVWCVVCVCVCE